MISISAIESTFLLIVVQLLRLQAEFGAQDFEGFRVVLLVVFFLGLIVEEESWGLVFSLLRVVVEIGGGSFGCGFYFLFRLLWLYFMRVGALLHRLFLLLLLYSGLFDWSYFARLYFLSFLLFPGPLLLSESLLLLPLAFLLLLKLPLILPLTPDIAKLDLHLFFDLLRLHQLLVDDQFILVLLLDLMFLIVMIVTFLLILLLIATIYADSFSLLSMSWVRRRYFVVGEVELAELFGVFAELLLDCLQFFLDIGHQII